MHILVLQHAEDEHPGSFRKLLKEDGHTWDAIELDRDEKLPLIDSYDALWVMGGSMDVWEEEKYPWLRTEKEFIRMAVAEEGLPYFGVCLGHQLLADALGGKVEPVRSTLILPRVERRRGRRGIECRYLLFRELSARPETLSTRAGVALDARRVGG